MTTPRVSNTVLFPTPERKSASFDVDTPFNKLPAPLQERLITENWGEDRWHSASREIKQVYVNLYQDIKLITMQDSFETFPPHFRKILAARMIFTADIWNKLSHSAQLTWIETYNLECVRPKSSQSLRTFRIEHAKKSLKSLGALATASAIAPAAAAAAATPVVAQTVFAIPSTTKKTRPHDEDLNTIMMEVGNYPGPDGNVHPVIGEIIKIVADHFKKDRNLDTNERVHFHKIYHEKSILAYAYRAMHHILSDASARHIDATPSLVQLRDATLRPWIQEWRKYNLTNVASSFKM